MIYRIGNPKGAWDLTNYALMQGLYESDGSWIADVGLAWNYASWYIVKMAIGDTPDRLAEPYANLQSLEVCVRAYLGIPIEARFAA